MPYYLDKIECKSYYKDSILYKYSINYVGDNKKINLEISKINSNKRSYYDSLDNIISSKISDKDVKVFNNNDNFIVFFKINDYNFDIESYGINKEELEDFIKKIISK